MIFIKLTSIRKKLMKDSYWLWPKESEIAIFTPIPTAVC